ncbi:hypothetical protein [Arthrobacter silvisoli]
MAGRYGGEEFIVLLPGAGQESARVITETASPPRSRATSQG